MKRIPVLSNILITAAILLVSFGISLLLQNVFQVQEHITTVFVFAVFLISLTTDGYAYGIVAAFLATIAVNYAFTFPFFSLNFTIPVNLISAVVMIILSVLTSALTTKVKRHEAIKAESEKERMRANLLRAVSHDLRTPLTTIYGSSAALLESRNEMTPQQQAQILRGIKEDSQWLVRMVENLLSITRIDSGKVKLLKTPTVLEELVDSVVLKFNKHYPQQEVQVEIPEEMVLIPMDAILIEQVIINILENAVQHAEGMRNLMLRVFTLGNQAIFEILDDGCGISQERRDKLFLGFGDFASQHKPADGQKRNAGIGLSVCATIIKAHGGDIRAENRSCGGTVFRFTLAIEEQDDEQ